MFMVVGFPWPVPSANDQLSWYQAPGDGLALDTARGDDNTTAASIEHRALRPEELVCWTGPERLRFLWYRLRLTINASSHGYLREARVRLRSRS